MKLLSLFFLLTVILAVAAANTELENKVFKEFVNFALGQIPIVGDILARIQSLFWPTPSKEAKIMEAVKKEMGKLSKNIDVTRVVEAQKKYQKSYREFEDFYDLHTSMPDNHELLSDIRRHLGDAQESCNRIEAQLESMKDNRKHLLPYAGASAALCLSMYRSYVQNATSLYRASGPAAEKVRNLILCQMKADKDSFQRLGQTMYNEWRNWRRNSIRIDFTLHARKKRWGMVGVAGGRSEGTIRDSVTGKSKHESYQGGSPTTRRNSVMGKLNRLKEQWFNEANGKYGNYRKLMEASALDRYFQGLGTPTDCRSD